MKREKIFIPVMLTPFKENGEIDYDGLTELVEFYIQGGSGKLFTNCQSSEMYNLTDDERIALTSHVVKIADGRVPVVATGTFSKDTNVQAEFVKRIYDTGIEAVVCVSGVMVDRNETDEIFEGRVFDLMDRTGDIPLGFYECPIPYKRVLSADSVKKFVTTGRLTYLKECSHDLQSVRSKLAASEGTGFKVYEAYMGNALDSIKAGAAGFSCIQGNFCPELVVWLADHYNDANLEKEVNAIQEYLWYNLALMERDYQIVARYFLQQRGVPITTYSRVNQNKLSKEMLGAYENLKAQWLKIQTLVGLPTDFYPIIKN